MFNLKIKIKTFGVAVVVVVLVVMVMLMVKLGILVLAFQQILSFIILAISQVTKQCIPSIQLHERLPACTLWEMVVIRLWYIPYRYLHNG